ASFLGLDGDKIIKQNPKAFDSNVPKQDFDYGIGTLEVRNPQSSSAKILPNAVWIVIGIVVLIGAWFFARAIGVF
nr:hypothetical protein [Candidatus Anoxychlamydiales bacterium]